MNQAIMAKPRGQRNYNKGWEIKFPWIRQGVSKNQAKCLHCKSEMHAKLDVIRTHSLGLGHM